MPDDGGPFGPEATEASGAMSESENEYDDNDTHHKDDDEKMSERNTNSEGVDANGGEVKKKYDPKDPMRPRRKKARRACYACQRAHLTCGDERPCQRCIKRGLMDTCQDGVRKKAKYLHDAPPEALRPVLGPTFNPNAGSGRHGHRHHGGSASEASTVGTFFSQAASQYPVYSSTQSLPAGLESLPFGSQQSPVSPTFQTSGNPTINGMVAPPVSSPMTPFGGLPFDPSDPNIFNFNLEGLEALNFGSQYGALEFGMLGHMSSGAAETPPHESGISHQHGDGHYNQGVFANGGGPFDNNRLLDFLGLDAASNGIYSQGNLQHGLPHAYAIAAGPTSLQSPSTENNSPQPTNFGFDERSPTMATYSSTPGNGGNPVNNRPPKQANPLAKLGGQSQSILGKRQRDPSYIYDTVKKSFDYVGSFHKLFELLRSRFSQQHAARIAKSLAAIRPALLSSTRNLTPQDLIFMEKYFQRTLFEYEDFMHHSSSPTLACRRTGEIAGVNKEFTALTGWKKDVLLGKEPNRNTNLGGPIKGRGLTTPRLKSMNAENNPDASTDTGPRPMFLAELMDHDSAVEFYEDYSQLAFNDSRGKMTRKCRLLKYRTDKPAEGSVSENDTTPTGAAAPAPTSNTSASATDNSPQKNTQHSILSNRVAKIDGEHGISKLEKDGKLECTYTWTIKRDMFDMPMLFVINFLPCYYRNVDHQAI
ncbi:putative transcription factor [Podospora australis]|uniref:Transcription factor n=1 Tax=Podospora australis TaxID=1536484 RepID=A0AAN7AEG1_9PEZI|nr:putative transcription factor [Podospora australis]